MSLTRYTFFGPWVREPDPAGTYVTLADVRALVEEACQRLDPDVPAQYECIQLLHDSVAALKETP